MEIIDWKVVINFKSSTYSPGILTQGTTSAWRGIMNLLSRSPSLKEEEEDDYFVSFFVPVSFRPLSECPSNQISLLSLFHFINFLQVLQDHPLTRHRVPVLVLRSGKCAEIYSWWSFCSTTTFNKRRGWKTVQGHEKKRRKGSDEDPLN